ncbi:hypothetical protein [Proteiniclasticum ruminis]|uniref:SipW-cognate class signal peptide n=1 Tax=Proteiniclasticum ruminis TaxID=398199 RepID=A0A1G8K5I7_9CLOT|nr:hypothetical protein [Proteiniclasticum ruminis]SDI38672.1 hypothetical protein SAMN05421804_102209 [Proteiniclasticum ruminis]
MKRNKRIIAVLAITSILAVMVFQTLAFFTAEDTALNRVTMGNVALILNDDTIDPETEDLKPFPVEGFDLVMPGDVIDKIVSVTNDGDNPIWVRVRLDRSIILAGEAADVDFNVLGLDLNDEDWTEGTDGWFYYNEILAPGETTENLFTQVTFPTSLGNAFMNARVEIDVLAQGVQSQNNGVTVQEAAGWPAE